MKRSVKTITTLSLAAAMLLSLAACGKESEAPETPEEEKPSYAYTAAYQPIAGSSGYMSPMIFTEDGFYAVSSEKVGEEIPEGAEVEYEGQYDVYENRLLFVGNDGKTRQLKDYVPLPRKENPGTYPEFYSGSGVEAMAQNADGDLVVVENNYVSYFDGPEEDVNADNSWESWVYESNYYIRVLDDQGKEKSRTEIDYDSQEGYLNFYRMCLDDKGNLLGTSENRILAFAPDGSLAYSIETEDYFDGFVRLRDGRMALPLYGKKGMELCIVDFEARKLTDERYALPNGASGLLRGGGDHDLYYTSGQSFYGYKLETEEAEKLLNWLDVDVNGNRVSGVNVCEDGSLVVLANNYENETMSTELVLLTRVPYDEAPQKQELTLAVMDVGYNDQLSNAIIRYNRASKTHRIRVLDYAQYNTEEDYSAGLTKLTTEILSGNLPDLLCLSGLPYKQLAAKGLLEDLYPYLDADKELSREDFFPTVLKAMEVDGKLQEVCASFAIQSLIGASSVVGDRPGWTYADVDKALAKMPEGCELLDMYTTREDMLRNLVLLEMDELVDWSTGKVSFDSEAFIEILKFSARFPQKFDWDNYEWSDADQAENRIQEGRQLLLNASIYYMNNIIYNDLYFGGETTYIGYPTSKGVGNMLQLGAGDGGLYAMSSSCADKEAGWQFLRSFLTEKNQQNVWGLPTNVKAFDAQLKKAMTPEYRKDAEGNFVLNENGERIQVSRGTYGMADGSVKNIYALTQEQADKLMAVIESTTKVVNDSDSSIFDIVNEQAQAFFAGQKSAEEVARLIQSKANIYVNEQR